MDKIRLGVIGTGMAWDRLHYPALQALQDKYQIVAICNHDINKANAVAQTFGVPSDRVYSDMKQLLNNDDIDAVEVLVPISENFEVAQSVLMSGKNLIIEKPFTSSVESSKELLQLQKRKNLKVLVAENFRYEQENNLIKDIINQGKIGQVVYFIENKVSDFTEEMKQDTFAAKEWRQHPRFKGGIFLDAGVHDIARMRFLFGDVDTVYATGRPQEEEFCPYSCINALLKFRNGVAGHYTFFPRGYETQAPFVGLRIFGTEGQVFLESKERGNLFVSYKDGNTEQLSYSPGSGYYNELLNFYNAIKNNEEIVSTPDKETGDIQVIYDILESIERNNAINVKSVLS